MCVCVGGGVFNSLVYNFPQDDHVLRLPLTLNWRRGTDMPSNMGTTVQAVVLGDNVYVGGGGTDNDCDSCTVMKLNLQQNRWTKLPQYSTKYFAMTSHTNQLVLVGGRDPVTQKQSNLTAVFESGKWTHPYPPMNVARHSSTAVCFNNYIIVAGGRDNLGCTSSVEVLDAASKRWYTAESLPNPRSHMKSTLIRNTLYIMGGIDQTQSSTKVVHIAELNELIAKAVSKQVSPILWQVIEDTPLRYSAPLSIGGSLLAIGGRDDRSNPSSSIYLYQPDTRRWVRVGNLPTARILCVCSVLSSGEVIVAGGQTGGYGQWTSTIDFLSIFEA